MVVGVPNSGKSTIINAMVKRQKRLRVTDRVLRAESNGCPSTTLIFGHAGHVVGQVRGSKGCASPCVYRLDKGGYFGRERALLRLHRRDEKIYPDALKNRYNLGELSDDTLQIFEQIAMARGFKLKGNQPDYERTAKTIIDDFRKGKLGKIILEKPKKITLSEN